MRQYSVDSGKRYIETVGMIDDATMITTNTVDC